MKEKDAPHWSSRKQQEVMWFIISRTYLLFWSAAKDAICSVGIPDFVATNSVPQLSISSFCTAVDVSYAAPQAHRIVNVTLYRQYSLGIVFIFFQGRKDLYHV
jgi:hypothetical protein